MQDLIERFHAYLAEHRPEYLARLKPGLSDGELDRWSARLGVAFPDDFRSLYRWRNGEHGDIGVAYNHSWLPLEDVANHLDFYRTDWEETMLSRQFPSMPDWLPLLSNCAGDTVFIDLEGAAGGVPGEVFMGYHDVDFYSVEHPSLRAWLETLVVGFERDLMGWEDGEFWQEEGFAAVHDAINPGYPKIIEYGPGEDA